MPRFVDERKDRIDFKDFDEFVGEMSSASLFDRSHGMDMQAFRFYRGITSSMPDAMCSCDRLLQPIPHIAPSGPAETTLFSGLQEKFCQVHNRALPRKCIS